MYIIGISAFYHDSAAVLIKDGDIIAAAQEERFTRKKHDEDFPVNAITFCLAQEGLTLEQIDHVAFYDKPFLKFERLLETYMAFAPKGFTSFKMAIPIWLREKLFQKNLLGKKLKEFDSNFDVEKKLLFGEHHQSHAASAFFPSPFKDAAVLTMDGVGEWATTSVAMGRGNTLAMTKEIYFPHSLGLLYSAFTYYTGFRVNSGEYKVMGLAPYGDPKYADLILDNIIDLKEDGSFRLDQSYFDYCTGLRMTNDKFADLFGGPARAPKQKLTQREMDLAASIQKVIEEAVLRMTRSIACETGSKNLCLAGGVALNCVANGRVLRDSKFDNIWVQPASGDAGGALGAALCAYHLYKGGPRKSRGTSDAMRGSYLGPEYEQGEIEKILSEEGAHFRSLSDDELLENTADALADNKAVGWFQGRMEYGPRALGGRSILGDPRSELTQKTLNLKVKYRESFRPFAPSILSEDVSDWFEIEADSRYMLMVADVARDKRRTMNDSEKSLFGIEKLNVKRSEIPAVTHVDYSARIQTVHKEISPRYHAVISKCKERTGCPVVVNTSFSVRGEPIVNTPADSFRCFMGTDMDVLAIGNCYLKKQDQDPKLKRDYKDAFELD